MGLDTSHNCWHGSYSSFDNFRRMLGKQIGIELDEFEGYGGKITWVSLKHDIKPLLNHSDCEGKLTVAECKKVAKGLDEILKNFNEEIVVNDSVEYLKDRIKQFRDGCLEAVSKGEVVEFH